MNLESLAELTASRVCHDLISPIGALSNGLELTRETGALGGEEMQLIEDCAEAASATLRFYRVAFGAASGGEALSANETTAIVAPFMKQKRIDLVWPVAPDGGSRSEVKLRLLLLLCVIDTLPRGGLVRNAPGGAFGWVASAAKLLPQRLSDRIDAARNGREPTAGDVHVTLMLREAEKRGLSCDVRHDEESGELSVTLS